MKATEASVLVGMKCLAVFLFGICAVLAMNEMHGDFTAVLLVLSGVLFGIAAFYPRFKQWFSRP